MSEPRPITDLVHKYRPTSLAGLLGQPWAARQLALFAEAPCPCAWLFEGGTGTGKTSAALLLAGALGLAVAEGPYGGLYQIASGEQTAETVRKTMEGLRCRPFFGSGWKVLVVNEADAMTAGAAFVWLDALEDLPPRTVALFTTNAPSKIPARLRDRCERLAFESSALLLRPYLQELTDRVWREEGCRGAPPDALRLGVADENGDASFRRLLQKLAQLVRAGEMPPAPATAAVKAPASPGLPGRPDRPGGRRNGSEAARKAWATRRARQAQNLARKESA
jgi:replication-associated recombination protein RarA